MAPPGQELDHNGTIGLPLLYARCRVRTADDRRAERGETGETGELQVAGPLVTPGHWRRPEATAEAFTADGWLRTGDAARQHPTGSWCWWTVGRPCTSPAGRTCTRPRSRTPCTPIRPSPRRPSWALRILGGGGRRRLRRPARGRPSRAGTACVLSGAAGRLRGARAGGARAGAAAQRHGKVLDGPLRDTARGAPDRVGLPSDGRAVPPVS